MDKVISQQVNLHTIIYFFSFVVQGLIPLKKKMSLMMKNCQNLKIQNLNPLHHSIQQFISHFFILPCFTMVIFKV